MRGTTTITDRTISESIYYQKIFYANVDFNGLEIDELQLNSTQSYNFAYFCSVSDENKTLEIKNITINNLKINRNSKAHYLFFTAPSTTSMTTTTANTFKFVRCYISCQAVYYSSNINVPRLMAFPIWCNRGASTYNDTKIQFISCVLKIYSNSLGTYNFLLQHMFFYNSEIEISAKNVNTNFLFNCYYNTFWFLINCTLRLNIQKSTASAYDYIYLSNTPSNHSEVAEDSVLKVYNTVFIADEECTIDKINVRLLSPLMQMPLFCLMINGSSTSFVPSATTYQPKKDVAYTQCIFDKSTLDVSTLKRTNFVWYDYSGQGFTINFDDNQRNTRYYSDGQTDNWIMILNYEINDGIPFLPFWFYPTQQAETVDAVPYQSYVRVHDSVAVRTAHNKKYDFRTNGIRLIQPISCTVTEEENGLYMCELQHYTDADGDWKTLKPNNILSVPILYHDEQKQQLFRIANLSESSKNLAISVTAKQIFYDLQARSIVDAEIVNLNGYEAIYYLNNTVYVNHNEYDPVDLWWYPYEFSSDITNTYSATLETTNLIAALLGDDKSLISQLGGYLYRDNFYYSINKQKEGSLSAGRIVYGVDMTEIQVDFDWSNFVNYVVGYDNFGNSYAIGYADFYGGELGAITRCLKFNYDSQEESNKHFEDDVNAYFDKFDEPVVNAKIDFSKLKNSKNYGIYTDFIKLENYEVGDTVTLYCELFDLEIQTRIIKKVFDVVTQTTKSIELSNQRNSIFRKQYLSDTVYNTSPDVRALQKEIGKKE